MGPNEPLPSNVIRFPGGRTAAEQSSLPGLSEVDHHEREVTVLLAELRDWSSVSEQLGHAQARVALSKAIDAALGALANEGGAQLTLDGDPAQPTIACEFEGGGASLRALRGAVAARRAIAESQSPAAPDQQFRVGVGIDTGQILKVRADESLTYEAIGAMRTVAARLRDFAGPGQIFLTRHVLEESEGLAEVQPLGDVRINVHGEVKEAFSLTGLTDG
jgi:class 3 adenylate cyclase